MLFHAGDSFDLGQEIFDRWSQAARRQRDIEEILGKPPPDMDPINIIVIRNGFFIAQFMDDI